GQSFAPRPPQSAGAARAGFDGPARRSAACADCRRRLDILSFRSFRSVRNWRNFPAHERKHAREDTCRRIAGHNFGSRRPVPPIGREPMIAVRRLGHATLTTPDIDRQVAYYTTVVGLTLRERACRASKQGLEAVALEPGPPNALSRLAFQVAPGSDLAELARELAKHGVKSERRSCISPGVAEAIVLKDPKDTWIEIFCEYVFAKEDSGQVGIMPLKLWHVAYRVNDW